MKKIGQDLWLDAMFVHAKCTWLCTCLGLACITNSQVSMEQIVSQRVSMVQLDNDVKGGFPKSNKKGITLVVVDI